MARQTEIAMRVSSCKLRVASSRCRCDYKMAATTVHASKW